MGLPTKEENMSYFMLEPMWANESTYNTYSDHEKDMFGIPRRLKF